MNLNESHFNAAKILPASLPPLAPLDVTKHRSAAFRFRMSPRSLGKFHGLAEGSYGVYRRRLPPFDLLLVLFARLDFAFAVIALFDFFVRALALAFGIACFNLVCTDARVRVLLGAAAATPALLRRAKYSFIGSK